MRREGGVVLRDPLLVVDPGPEAPDVEDRGVRRRGGQGASEQQEGARPPPAPGCQHGVLVVGDLADPERDGLAESLEGLGQVGVVGPECGLGIDDRSVHDGARSR